VGVLSTDHTDGWKNIFLNTVGRNTTKVKRFNPSLRGRKVRRGSHKAVAESAILSVGTNHKKGNQCTYIYKKK
jgi:hypothetical protein